MKTLFLAETEAHVHDLLKRKEAENALWVALTPFAMHALDKKGLTYKIVDDFYSVEELWEAALECEGIERKIIARLDDFATSKSGELKKRGIKLYTSYGYPLHIMFDAVFMRIFQLESMINAIKPDRIYCHKPEVYPFYSWLDIGYIGFDKRESLYARILEKSRWRGPVNFINMPKSADDIVRDGTGAIRSCKKINSVITRMKEKLPFLRKIKKYGIGNFFKAAPVYFKNGKSLTLIGGGYEWDECEYLFNMNGVKLRRLDVLGDNDSSYIESPVLEKELYEAVRDLLVFSNVDVSSFVISRLIYVYTLGQKKCISSYDAALRHINKYNPRALLFSTLSIPEARSAALVFNQRNIPVFCKPHGIFGITQIIKIIDSDLLYTNYYLANGPQTAKVYQKYLNDYNHNNLKILSTGSPRIEHLKNSEAHPPKVLEEWIRGKDRKSKKVGIYVTTNYMQNFYYAYFRPAPSDEARFISQKKIINFFKNRDDCLLIWKLHPNHISDRPPLLEDGFGNIFTIRDEASFADLLDVAEFIIMDDAFTVCQEAVTRKDPMFILTKHVYYYPETRNMLAKRAVCCDDLEDLTKKIEKYISCGKYDADVNDDTFLSAFAVNEDGRHAVEKTVSEVMRIIDIHKTRA